MLKFAALLIAVALSVPPAQAQYIYSESASISGNTVTVTIGFAAQWSSTWDSNCPYFGQVYPYQLNSMSYQVDGGSSINIPYSDVQQRLWATECSSSSDDNEYVIQFSYNDTQPGNHSVQVTVGYADDGGDVGYVYSDQLPYSVSGGILIDGGNLDDSDSWNYCTESSCSKVAPTYKLWPLAHVSSPSTTGSALETYQYGPAYWGILYYYPHSFTSQEINSTNFKVQWQYYVDSSSYIQALEFDFPVIYNNLAFYFGSQCVQGGNWQYWNINTTSWVDFSPAISCTQTSAGTWHTLVWYGSRTSSQFTYQTLEIDGQQYSVNTTLTAPANSTGIANNTITIQFQPDGNYVDPNPGYHEYVDNIQAWVW